MTTSIRMVTRAPGERELTDEIAQVVLGKCKHEYKVEWRETEDPHGYHLKCKKCDRKIRSMHEHGPLQLYDSCLDPRVMLRVIDAMAKHGYYLTTRGPYLMDGRTGAVFTPYGKEASKQMIDAASLPEAVARAALAARKTPKLEANP